MFTPDDRSPSHAGNSLTITPLDLRQARFGTSLRGFDKNEVAAFLLEAADAYEQALRENERLRQELARQEATLAELRQTDETLKSTLASAHKIAEEMRENASIEAGRVVREAEARASLIIERAQGKADELIRDTESLRMRRREVESGIEGVVAMLNHTIEFIREQDQRERDERVVPHRARFEATARTA
jgi:cell division initiation protein